MSAARILRPSWAARYAALAAIGSTASYNLFHCREQLRCDSGAFWGKARHTITSKANSHDAADPIHQKRGDSPTLSKPLNSEEPQSYAAGFEDDDTSAWLEFSRNVSTGIESFSSIEWGSIGDSIADFIVPKWARQIPDQIKMLQRELSMAPGSLADDIWQEAHSVEINPEILWDARVRIGNELCREELEFKVKRKKHVVKALAKYLDIPEEEIDPRDVPTIAMCGSGGGLRALVAGTGSYLSTQETGLFDCVTYTAGVSGSCWLQTLYHSSIVERNFNKLVSHLKHRIGIHIAYPPTALELLISAPTNKFLLSGFVEKLKGDPDADFGLVDVYGLLLAARLLVPKGDLGICDLDLKLSNQRTYIDDGTNPMPIYTAVRHEIPIEEKKKEGGEAKKEHIRDQALREAWFQWFEFTPYEFFCEELSAGIPSWALGRPFENGRNKILDSGVGLPELRVPLMMGIWGSAFCATLAHYCKEIRPLLEDLAGFGGIDALLEDKDEDLVKIHPIDPATIPNYVMGMKDQLPASCPESIFKTDHFQLMDAGMSNNLPIYPLLRRGRDIDILITFDASADIKQENWLAVVDGYARQRGIIGWPIGAGWPHPSSKPTDNVTALDEAQVSSSQDAATKVAEAREDQRQADNSTRASTQQGKHSDPTDSDLGYCTVWVGTTEERRFDKEPPPSKRLALTSDDPDNPDAFQLMEPNAGLAVIYFPFLPNKKVPGVDPDRSDFMSTWNFVYTPEDIDQVVNLARANFEEGKEQTKRTVRAVYERKKMMREEKEGKFKIKKWKKKLREHGDSFAGS